MRARALAVAALFLGTTACERLMDATRRRIDAPSPFGEWSVVEVAGLGGTKGQPEDVHYWLRRRITVADSAAVIGRHLCPWPTATTTLVVDGATFLDSAYNARPRDIGLTQVRDWYSLYVAAVSCQEQTFEGLMVVWPHAGSDTAYMFVDSLKLTVERQKR